MQKRLFILVVVVLFGSMASHARFYEVDSLKRELATASDTEKTFIYHQIADFYDGLGYTAERTLGFTYETEALLWEYSHHADPLTLASTSLNLSYYYFRMKCYFKAAMCGRMALNFYARHRSVDSLKIEEAKNLVQFYDTFAATHSSAVYHFDSVQYVDHPMHADSTINRIQEYYTAAHFLRSFDQGAFVWPDIREILLRLEEQAASDLTPEQRSQLYFELVSIEYSRLHDEELINHARSYIACTPRNEAHADMSAIVYLLMGKTINRAKKEPDMLPYLDEQGLYDTYTNVLFHYANRISWEGDKKEAKRLKKQAWQYAEKHHVTHCSACIEERHNEARLYVAKNDYKTAASIYQKAFGDTLDASTLILANAMVTFYRAGLYEKGWEIDQRVVYLDPDNQEYIYWWNGDNLYYDHKHGIVFNRSTIEDLSIEGMRVELNNVTDIGSLQLTNVDLTIDSVSTYAEAQVYTDSMFIGKEHANIGYVKAGSRYLTDVNALIQLLINQGNYEAAEAWCHHAMEVIDHLGDKLPPNYFAQTNYYLALICAHRGEWKQVLDCLNAALPYYLEREDYETIALFFTLGSQYYQHFYLYTTALERAETAASAFRSIDTEQWNADKLVNVFLNLAKCYMLVEDYDTGVSLMHELLDYVEEHQGWQHINYGKVLLQMLTYADFVFATDQSKENAYWRAEYVYTQHEDALLKTASLAQVFGKEYIDLYTIGAQVFSGLGKDSLAAECSDMALLKTIDIYGEDHPYIIPAVIQEVQAYIALGNKADALQNAKGACLVAKDAYGEHHWTVGDMQWCVAECYLALNDYPHFELYADSVVENFKYNIRHEFTFLTAAQRADYWERQNKILSAISEQALLHPSPKLQQLAYDISLLIKGMLLKTQTEIFEIVERSGDEDLRYMYIELLQLNEQQRLSVEKNLPFTKEQQQQKEKLEKQIQQRVLQYGDYTQVMAIQWEHVRKALKQNEVAIEFVNVPFSEDTVLYCAMVLHNSSSQPELIPLFWEQDARAMMKTKYETQLNATYRYDEYGQPLAQLVWGKLMAAIRPGEKVYFAPVGILYQLAIETLPYDEKRTMEDVYDLVRVSSTRELTFRKKTPKHSAATLYGGIQYDLPTDSLSNETIDYLPGTYVEAEAIGEMLRQNKIRVKLFTSTLADEASFKALSGTRQNILHIGTHGFFQKEEYNDDPLYRCGLLFADGVLNGKEISLLDLKDADLVVLSACETAKGDVTGEGVFGLQRAFKQAGVQTIIMSLWDVHDDATELLITEFYRNWIILHQTKRDALHNARNAVRNARDERGELLYEEPIYWAGFIMLD